MILCISVRASQIQKLQWVFHPTRHTCQRHHCLLLCHLWCLQGPLSHSLPHLLHRWDPLFLLQTNLASCRVNWMWCKAIWQFWVRCWQSWHLAKSIPVIWNCCRWNVPVWSKIYTCWVFFTVLKNRMLFIKSMSVCHSVTVSVTKLLVRF